MKTTWSITTIGMILVLFLVAAAIMRGRTVANLRRENQTLQTELIAIRARTTALANEKQETQRQLELVVNQHGELTSRLAELEAAEAAESAMATSAAALKPYQAEAYLGNKSLGRAWIVPRNLHKDTNTQRFVYEPVVCLDEKLRSLFVVNYTNIVERETDRPVYVNNSYYPQPYYYTFPARDWPPPTNHRPTQPSPGPTPNPPTFNPGGGNVIKQTLGTSAARIKTSPSAPQLPANPAPVQPQAGPLRAAKL